jgi:prevent-host-death family protein
MDIAMAKGAPMGARVKKLPGTIPAGQFKNVCLSLMDQIAAQGAEVVVTKRGRPIVRVVPAEPIERKYPVVGSLAGSVVYLSDVTAPEDDEEWEADRE